MHKALSTNFFNRPTLQVARELLGKFLVRRVVEVRPALRARKNKPNFHYPVQKSRSKEISAMITEVEAYVGPKDKASHASRGRTKRTEVMFGKHGYWYVYMIYGMHYCLNVVTEKEKYPAAVLIRSVIPRPIYSNILKNIGIDEMKGPGRVCKYFKVDKRSNARTANTKTGLWIEDRNLKINPRHIRRGKRVGVDYAGKWKEKLWRFYLK